MRTTPLAEVVAFTNGGTPSRSNAEFWHGSIPWITGADITDDGEIAARSFISQSAVSASSTQLLPQGTVVLLTRTSVGKVGVLPEPMAINQDITGITPSPDLETRYLVHFLRASKSRLLKNLRGATIKGVTREDVASLELLLPPLPEQRRIAAILDQADALRAKRRQVLDHLDTLVGSTFYAMFGDQSWRSVTTSPPEAGPLDREWVRLTDVAQMATGHTPDRNRSDYWDGDIPWISLPEIRTLDGRIAQDTSLHVAQAGLDHSSAVLLPAGTVCFSRTASIGFVTVMGRPMSTSQDFHNWVPGPALSSEYLMAALRVSRTHLLGNCDGSTHKTIYQRVAEGFTVLLPRREQQAEFERRMAAVRAMESSVQRALAADDELFACVQSRAFRGDL